MEIDEENFPPSDQEMMEKIVPQFVDEDQFMVYCLTVSGHLKYDYERNSMARRHWNQVSELGYSEAVTAYLPARWSWSWPWRAWSTSWRRRESWTIP